jgi:hypothetical protein
MQRYILIILLALCQLVYSQEITLAKPNYKKISKEIKSKKSGFYYPDLMQRYLNSDSTFTLEQKRHLYYGYTFQPEYSPYTVRPYQDSIRVINRKDTLVEADYRALLRFADTLLAIDPFNLRALNTRLFVYDHEGDDQDFLLTLPRMNAIFDAIMSSGDGTSKETAFYVINVSHEYDILGYIGFNFGGQQSLVEHYDYLTVKKNQYGLSGLYFDISPCLKHLNSVQLQHR